METKDTDVPHSPRDYSLDAVLELTRKLGLFHDYVVELVLATYISKELGDRNPLWLMLVGEPSSNKTVCVSLLKDAADVFTLDNMTANAFISGSSEKDGASDLLPKLNGKCLVFKEYGSLFGQSEETVKKIISELVAIYDGEFTKHSGVRGTIKCESLFSHVGCITPSAINQRQRYMNLVGARFLILRIPQMTEEQTQECEDKIAWDDDFPQHVKKATEAASGLVNSICDSLKENKNPLPTIEPSIRKQINLIANLTASARGEVKTKSKSFVNEEGDEVHYQEVEEVQVERPFRAIHQFKLLCIALAIIRGKEEVTAEEVKVARLVSLSTMPVNRADMLSAFRAQERLSASDVSEILEKSYGTTKRHLDALASLKVVCTEKEDKTTYYYPHPKFKNLIAPQEEVL